MSDTSTFNALWSEANARIDADGGGFSPNAVLLLRQAVAIAEDDYAQAVDAQGEDDDGEYALLNAQDRLANVLGFLSRQLWLSDSKDDQDEALALRTRAAELHSAVAEECTDANSHFNAYCDLKWLWRRLFKRAFRGQWRLFWDAWGYFRRGGYHFWRMQRILRDHDWTTADIKAANVGKIPVPMLYPVDVCDCELCADEDDTDEDDEG